MVIKVPDLLVRLSLLVICLGLPLGAAAQLPGITFSHYGSDDGLPNDNISALAFDREGFLWVGTTDGLARFDGRRFEVFRHAENDPSTIPFNIIYGIQTDPLGRLWVSTEQGLCWYDAQNKAFHQVFVHRLDSEKEPYIGWLSSLLVGSDGYGWFGAASFLIRMDLSTFEMVYYPYPDNLGGICTPFEDTKHRFWLNLAGRTYRFFRETGTFKYYQGHTPTGILLPAVWAKMRKALFGRAAGATASIATTKRQINSLISRIKTPYRAYFSSTTCLATALPCGWAAASTAFIFSP